MENRIYVCGERIGLGMEKDWDICALTETGIRHKRHGRGCEDQLTIRRTEESIVAVLADGAGSRSHAAEGARLVADVLATWLEREFERIHGLTEAELCQEIIALLMTKLRHQSEMLGVELRELASTLLFAAVKDDRYVFGNLGDGVIGYQKDTGRWVVCGPEHGSLPGQTYFVTSERAVEHLYVRIGTGTIGAFAMMTDGVAEVWFQEETVEMTEDLESAMEWLGAEEAVANKQMQEYVKTEIQKQVWDDIGFILARRRETD